MWVTIRSTELSLGTAGPMVSLMLRRLYIFGMEITSTDSGKTGVISIQGWVGVSPVTNRQLTLVPD